MSSAAESYQWKIEHALHGLPGVRNISDDIIIGGRSTEELLKTMDDTFQRLRIQNLNINKSKCKFLQDELHGSCCQKKVRWCKSTAYSCETVHMLLRQFMVLMSYHHQHMLI